jgi:hypothetical protein
MMKLKEMQGMGKVAAMLLGLAAGPLWAGTEGASSTFYGQNAGASGSGSSGVNTLVGNSAGFNTTGTDNTFLGYGVGFFNTSGYNNTFLGLEAGFSNITGYDNTFLGKYAGSSNQIGSGNVFLGFYAGSSETGSNKLYIDKCFSGGSCTPPLLYGEFDNHLLNINGVTSVSANSIAKSQMHFSLDNGDYGGFLTSVLQNNFFVSSGARYDSTVGGWIQRSADGNAMIAGSGAVGYRIFSHTGGVVGSSFTLGAPRLHIDYSGQFGINTAPVAGHEIHTLTGAYEMAGSWVDASSRDLKDNIVPLTNDDAAKALAELNPVRYNYKVTPDEGHVGFVAEDVPELVARKDRKGLAPMEIVAVLTKVVQEQKQALDEKTRRLDAQESLVATQQQVLARMEAKVTRMEQEVERLKRRYVSVPD